MEVKFKISKSSTPLKMKFGKNSSNTEAKLSAWFALNALVKLFISQTDVSTSISSHW